jgi:hypothetical protein
LKEYIKPKSMKTGINTSKVNVVTLLFFVSVITLTGQALPQIEARFANPAFNNTSREYFVDVELHSKLSQENLFGMNLRFFYDASLMTFQGVDQFHQGYGILGDAPKPFPGNATSGVQLFNFSQAFAYVNGAVQLLDERFPLAIPTNGWVKAFRLSFKLPATVLNQEQFCPSVIWDLEVNNVNGGFLPGSDGLVITVTENQRSTRFVSKSTIPFGTPFNWQYNSGEAKPFGDIVQGECINVETGFPTDVKDRLDNSGYELYQNQPNPFDGKTRISFVLPFAQEASIIFYDVDGAIKEEIKGFYEAGKNHLDIQQKAWMVESNIIYYRLKTDKYTSKTRTMTLVRA